MTLERIAAALLCALFVSCSATRQLAPANILVGSVVIIAGVAFVVVSAGAGLVILAPAVVLASPWDTHEPFMAGVSP
jgi:hypothetical protein